MVTASTTGAGWVAQGGSYIVYASATDAGSPATGVATVTASVAGITIRCHLPLAAQVHHELYRGRRHLRVQERHHRRRLAAGGRRRLVLGDRDRRRRQCHDRQLQRDRRQHCTHRQRRGGFDQRHQHARLHQAGRHVHRLRELRRRRRDQRRHRERQRTDCRADGGGAQRLHLQLHRGRRYLRLQEREQDSRCNSWPKARRPSRITSTDKAANATTTPFSVTIDNTGAVVTQTTIANTTTNAAGWIRKSGAYCFVRQRVRRRQRGLHGQGERLVDHQRADRSRAQRLLDRVHRRRCHLCLQECEQDRRLQRCPGGRSATRSRLSTRRTTRRPANGVGSLPTTPRRCSPRRRWPPSITNVARIPGAKPHLRRLRQCVGRVPAA